MINAYGSTLKIYNEANETIEFIERDQVAVISFLADELAKVGV